LNNLGVLALDRGDVEAARTLYEESLALRRELGDKHGVATALGNLGQIALDRQEFATAQALYTESLKLYRDLEDVQGSVECLEGLAGVASALGQVEKAARLGGALDRLWTGSTDTLVISDNARCEQCYAATQPQIDEATWAALWAEGRTMEIGRLIRYALGEP
jgi:tetratricopeptide (TPR) repeat protein